VEQEWSQSLKIVAPLISALEMARAANGPDFGRPAEVVEMSTDQDWIGLD